MRDRILCYHAVGTPEWGVNDVRPRHFERQLDVARRRGCSFASAAEIARGEQRDEVRIAVTFDDGLRSVAEHAVPILEDHDIPSTMFVVTKWADGEHETRHEFLMDWDEIGQLSQRGVAIGSHSATHPDFAHLSSEAALDELSSSRERIREQLGVEALEFAIPLGQSNNWTTEATRLAGQVGYTIVYSQSEHLRSEGTIPRTFVTRHDHERLFVAALEGAYDEWEEWY